MLRAQANSRAMIRLRLGGVIEQSETHTPARAKVGSTKPLVRQNFVFPPPPCALPCMIR